MDALQFKEVLAEQLQTCSETLSYKASEYASDSDRLHNFKLAAALEETTMRKALGGMMAKHTVSVYDLIRSAEADTSIEVWNEKITDHINYLILLKAIVIEEQKYAKYQKEHDA